MLHPSDYFDLNATAHAALFADVGYVWDVLNRIPAYIENLLNTVYPPNTDDMDFHPTVVIEGQVHIGEGVQIAPHTYIQGPTVIGDNAQIRHGAFVRANTLVGDGAVVGHATETKHAVLLEGALAPHFSYVGDSILGRDVNLGAGTKLSNFPMTGGIQSVVIPYEGERYDTGIVKFGAILGDRVQCGCNCVTNPGTLVGPRTLIYTLTMLRKGVYPADSVIKLRQTQEIVPRT